MLVPAFHVLLPGFHVLVLHSEILRLLCSHAWILPTLSIVHGSCPHLTPHSWALPTRWCTRPRGAHDHQLCRVSEVQLDFVPLDLSTLPITRLDPANT
eukprot:364385-Chlamydomonas_euryale.AAC.13